MSTDSSHEAILFAARRNFAENGYTRTTLRGIAREAGVSAALVIKHFGSKEELYAEAGHLLVPLLDLKLSRSQIGRALVQRIVTRRDENVAEPWATVGHSVRDAPDPTGARVNFQDSWLDGLARLIGDTSPGLAHSSVVACHLVGFAEGLRVMELFPSESITSDDLVDLWAAIVQSQIDACQPDSRSASAPAAV